MDDWRKLVMNRLSKLAMEQFKKMSRRDQVYILSKILKSKGYDDFNEKNKSKITEYHIPNNYLTAFLSTHYEANTINGRRRAKPTHFEADKLELIKRWMPNGRFAPSEHDSFQPLGNDVRCTKMMLPYVRSRREKLMIEEWNKIKYALRSKSLGKENEYAEPRLDYEPMYNNSQDVYFVLDRRDEIVKIGISHDIPKRLESIKRDYNTGELDVVSVIKSGGLAVEKLLHSYFAHIRFNQKGKGREWFKYNEEMSAFIKELNSHPIKSRVIESISA